MWDAVNVTTCPGNRVRFSLGQVFRMHADKGPYNWIFDQATPPVAKDCQKTTDSSLFCPFLHLDIWRRE
jgi:hypothetical protein